MLEKMRFIELFPGNSFLKQPAFRDYTSLSCEALLRLIFQFALSYTVTNILAAQAAKLE